VAILLDPIKTKWRTKSGGIEGVQGNNVPVARRAPRPSHLLLHPQQLWRKNWSVLKIAWAALTPGQLVLWATFASTYPVIDKYNNSVFQSGQNWFYELNGRLHRAELNLIGDPPVDDIPTYSPIVSVFQDGATGDIVLSFSTPVPTGSAISVRPQMNWPLSKSKRAFPFLIDSFVFFGSSSPVVLVTYAQLLRFNVVNQWLVDCMDEYGKVKGVEFFKVVPEP